MTQRQKRWLLAAVVVMSGALAALVLTLANGATIFRATVTFRYPAMVGVVFVVVCDLLFRLHVAMGVLSIGLDVVLFSLIFHISVFLSGGPAELGGQVILAGLFFVFILSLSTYNAFRKADREALEGHLRTILGRKQRAATVIEECLRDFHPDVWGTYAARREGKIRNILTLYDVKPAAGLDYLPPTGSVRFRLRALTAGFLTVLPLIAIFLIGAELEYRTHADAGGPYFATANETVTLSAAGSEDKPGEGLFCEWYLDEEPGPDAWGIETTYVWPNPGEYVIEVVVRDAGGFPSRSITRVWVGN